jgi:predicted RNA-binding Zn-ribbon protein involved in translation (DUF1610 family)
MSPSDFERERGWCTSCARAYEPDEDQPEELICPACGSNMKPLRSLSRMERSSLNFQDWMDDVYQRGLWGSSPGGAAAHLKCDRSMIDKLVERGILEKSVYDRDGHYVVMISDRSVEKAQENKEKRGKWTDSGED